ncbi:TonB-dependent receptor [Gimibacter soli]|uniref:TonB-dependent receptor n=1 Tax=Gimibacter soli TaxID=3024400 RepID=A0AAE9XRI2_9PROT|nr:TonB-dependent receptor [Gimibacter soli]WCL53856.1 TonB-dependent receptor [Gimibacter soli]
MIRNQYFGASMLALVASMPAFAQDAAGQAGDDFAIDEIVVTAQKREQTLQDVPISVAVTSQATIEKAQVRDMIDLQTVVPSLSVSQLNATGQTNFSIRGFGNGNGNDGIEASVGVFIDGVYRSRTSSALDDLPEIERVEVLRGPQSTLFGKNVSAGAISIVTAKPQFEFGGKAEVSVGNLDQRLVKASITGPLSDTVAVRVSGNYNKRDGYFDNLTTGTDVNNRDRWSVRGDLLWNPNEDFTLRVIGDYNEMNERCCGVVTILNGPATQFIGAPSPFGLGKPIGDPDAIFDRDVIFNADPANKLSGKGISAQADWQFDGMALTSITAWRNQKNASNQDIDFTGASISENATQNDIKTFTQELRLTSTGDGPLTWQLGAFYQDEKINTGRDISYGTDIRAFADGLSGQVPATLLGALPPPLAAALNGRSNIFALEFLQSLVNPSIVPGATYFQAGDGIHDFYDMDQRSYSLFGQFDYEVTERLTFTGGLAYLNDRKEVVSDVVLNDPFSSLNLQAVPEFPFLGLPGNIYGGLGALQFFYGNTQNHAPVNFPNSDEDGILKGDKLTYAARVSYDIGDVNTYISYAKGWKAGAYNLSSDSRPADVNGVGRSAGPEDVTVIEIGAKARFERGFINVALFDQQIKGFQSNAFTGLGYSLVNAGKQSTKGVEVDASYFPVDWIALTGAVTYLDPTYDSFPGAACVSYDTVRCPVDPATGRRPNFRDLTGDTPAGIPEWTFSTSATITRPITDTMEGFLRVEYYYVSDTHLTETTPPEVATYGTNQINASFGITNEELGLEVMLWARNLTNDEALISSFPTVAQDGSYSGYPNAPRTWGVNVKKTF